MFELCEDSRQQFYVRRHVYVYVKGFFFPEEILFFNQIPIL